MTEPLTIVGGAMIGMAAGLSLVPFTRRALAGSIARSSTGTSSESVNSASVTTTIAPPRISARHWAVLAVLSGLVPAFVLHNVGWSIVALPPLLLLVGLIQLAYCDLTRRLLPKTLVYALSAAVIVSGIVVAGVMGEWERLFIASIGAVAFFAFFFVMNLMNPRWIAFGDVRLSLVVGFGLAWVSWSALIEELFFANLLAAVVGLSLIAAHKADRRTAVPFGLYLAVGAAIILAAWS
jgi:leader peptidase (prepilin peptidase)/N-methyltransferase